MKDPLKDKSKNWKLWDAVFLSGLASFFYDCDKAQEDSRLFKQLLLQFGFALIFTVVLMAAVWLFIV
ncbi:hypothetical protein [Bacillus suaedaesalsae]|uniref:Uncharacterized protein n=1 Tax=Bacillus suaedaesalsae TaxID=2810349 RepID=A0ABS2DHK5_9BACI|nr:hypothetical protein [Bacillus suaedaesalsae]MBM6617948.1 hypothetical protein [Bacillus suaedaesalsae]